MIQYYNTKEKSKNNTLEQYKGEKNKMATLKESAMAYEPPTTKNIADLEKVSVETELKDGEGKDSSGEVFKYKYFEIEGQEYRVPGSVIGQIKAILQKMPTTRFVTVTKAGTDMGTKYVVMSYHIDTTVVAPGQAIKEETINHG